MRVLKIELPDTITIIDADVNRAMLDVLLAFIVSFGRRTTEVLQVRNTQQPTRSC
jgi:hypothetical protein